MPEIKFAPSYPRRKRFPRITSAGYEAGHRENFVGKARPTGRTIHYAAIHPRRQADGVFWPLPIKKIIHEVRLLKAARSLTSGIDFEFPSNWVLIRKLEQLGQ